MDEGINKCNDKVFFSQVVQTIERPASTLYICTSSQMIPPRPREIDETPFANARKKITPPSAQEGESMLSIPPSVVKALFFMMKNIIKRHYVPS